MVQPVRACVATGSSSRRSAAAASRARVSAQVRTGVVGRPCVSTPITLCQKVQTATTAISAARFPAAARVSSIASAVARTRSSGSTVASPSFETRSGRSRCAMALAIGRPRESNKKERRPDVPISTAMTSGAVASRNEIASGSLTSAAFLIAAEYGTPV